MKVDEMVAGKTYQVLDIFGQAEIRPTHVEVFEKERLNLTGFHDEFYIAETNKDGKIVKTREMRSNSLVLSIPLKNILGITEVAQGSESLLLLARNRKSD